MSSWPQDVRQEERGLYNRYSHLDRRAPSMIRLDGRSSSEAVVTLIKHGALAIIIDVLLPLTLIFLNLPGFAEYGYLMSTAVLACWLLHKKSPFFVAHCILVFCAVSLIRRLIDERLGFNNSNPVLLAPYVSCMVSYVVVGRQMLQSKWNWRLTAPYNIALLCIFYGLILAMISERAVSGLVDAMRWSVGPLMALYIVINSNNRVAVFRTCEFVILVSGVVMSVYGIYQYISPPAWDADWMTNILAQGLNSIGTPEPYNVRVFSTMNSPGSLAAVLSVAILIAFRVKTHMILVPLSLMVLGLLLTQYRAVWGGTGLGILLMTLKGPAVFRLRLIAVFGALALLVVPLATIPQISENIVKRVQTIGELKKDASGEDRGHQYATFLSDSTNNLLSGEGLAINGSVRRLDGKGSAVIDSGIIEVYTALGVFCGSIFFAALLGSLRATFASGRLTEGLLCQAVALSMIVQIPFGSVFSGEVGFTVWVFIGLAACGEFKGIAPATPVSGDIGLLRVERSISSKTRDINVKLRADHVSRVVT